MLAALKKYQTSLTRYLSAIEEQDASKLKQLLSEGRNIAMLWEVEIRPVPSEPNRAGARVAHEAADLGLANGLQAEAATAFLIQGDLDEQQINAVAQQLLVDPVVEQYRIARPKDPVC